MSYKPQKLCPKGLLGEEAVDDLAGLAFGGILGGGEAGAAGGP